MLRSVKGMIKFEMLKCQVVRDKNQLDGRKVKQNQSCSHRSGILSEDSSLPTDSNAFQRQKQRSPFTQFGCFRDGGCASVGMKQLELRNCSASAHKRGKTTT